MGASILYPEVLRFRSGTVYWGQTTGFSRMYVLDFTDPAGIRAIEAKIDFEAHAVRNATKLWVTQRENRRSTLPPLPLSNAKGLVCRDRLAARGNWATCTDALTQTVRHLDLSQRVAWSRQQNSAKNAKIIPNPGTGGRGPAAKKRPHGGLGDVNLPSP